MISMHHLGSLITWQIQRQSSWGGGGTGMWCRIFSSTFSKFHRCRDEYEQWVSTLHSGRISWTAFRRARAKMSNRRLKENNFNQNLGAPPSKLLHVSWEERWLPRHTPVQDRVGRSQEKNKNLLSVTKDGSEHNYRCFKWLIRIFHINNHRFYTNLTIPYLHFSIISFQLSHSYSTGLKITAVFQNLVKRFDPLQSIFSWYSSKSGPHLSSPNQPTATSPMSTD